MPNVVPRIASSTREPCVTAWCAASRSKDAPTLSSAPRSAGGLASLSRGVSVLARGGDQLRAKFENAHEIAGIYPVGRFSSLEEAVLADEMNDQPRPAQPVPRPQISDPPVNARELRFRTVPAIVR